ncbi:MAG TPA: Maf family protein [Candidatus Kapabacteria bacterium]|nr:Maf family protein [Candidatus Kapabacteria bacterium]
MPRTLFLASQSPRRASLIRLLGVQSVVIRASNIHEAMEETLTPAENVARLAFHKAQHVAEQLAGESGIVLGADTTVALENHVLNKPMDAADAERMLMLLSDATHTVHTGVSLIDIETKEERSFVESTQVTFRALSFDEIRSYIATGSPMDKAGAYGIQEDFGAVFVRRIEGDYYTVVGLPLCRLYVMLKDFAPDLWGNV